MPGREVATIPFSWHSWPTLIVAPEDATNHMGSPAGEGHAKAGGLNEDEEEWSADSVAILAQVIGSIGMFRS